MRAILYSLLALLALGLAAEPANSQVGRVRGYNSFTGRVNTHTVARKPLTGNVGVRNTTYNPFTGRAATNTVRANPFTGTTVRGGAAVNPMTGRVAGYGTVRRW